MPETYRSYQTYEVALFLQSKGLGAGGLELGKEGDIVAIRPPRDGIGMKEARRFLWLRIEGLDDNEMSMLTEPIEGYEKRRYSIPLDRLQVVLPQLDIVKARDMTQIHQPGLPIDTDGPYVYLADMRPLNAHGLVYDKQRRQYL